MKKFVVDIEPLDHEGFVLAASAIGRKYETAPVAIVGARLRVELLVAGDWPESAQTFFSGLQIVGMVKSWTKYTVPLSVVQADNRSY